MQTIVIKITCSVLLIFVQQSVAFPQEQAHVIKLGDIDHQSILHRKDLLADPRFELPKFTAFDNLRENGRIYLHCKLSGMVICAAPVKDSYQVLVFPRRNAEQFRLQITTSLDLLRDGVDAKSIESLLKNARPNMGMGYDPAKEKTRLKIRIEAIEESGSLEKSAP